MYQGDCVGIHKYNVILCKELEYPWIVTHRGNQFPLALRDNCMCVFSEGLTVPGKLIRNFPEIIRQM